MNKSNLKFLVDDDTMHMYLQEWHGIMDSHINQALMDRPSYAIEFPN